MESLGCTLRPKKNGFAVKWLKHAMMRIDHLLVTAPLRRRVVWAESKARKGEPLPSDHAPLVIDLDSPGTPFDAGWASAESRIALRRNQ